MLRDLLPLSPYMRRYRWRYLAGVSCCVCTNTIAVQFAQVIGRATNAIARGAARREILLLAGLLVLVMAGKGVFLYLQRWILIGVSREIEYDLRNDLFRHLERQDSGFYQRYRTGDIMARMTNDLNAVRNMLGPALMYSTNTLFFSIGAVIYLLRISPHLTLLALAPMPIASILVQYLGSRIHMRFERIQSSFSEISAHAQENFSAARLIRAFAREESEIGLFERLNREYIARSLRLVQLMGMLWPSLEFVLGVSMIVTLLVGGHFVLAGRITVGGFVAFNTYMVQLTWPIISIGWVVNVFERGTASVKRLDELMQQKPAIDDHEADPAIPADLRLRGEIEFRNLTFRHENMTALAEVNLHIPAGSTLAVLGPTGSGKSTLVNLLPRILEAPSGSLLIDGRPIREYPLEILRRNIGMAPQETFLFSEPIYENLTFGAPEASAEALEQATEAAQIRNEFAEFPAGLETPVGERGITLSGGQRQRTAIARAILGRPPILILDDALASVDLLTEERILNGLRSYMETTTTILITHRVSTARNADRIAVLIQGRIRELGTHEELLAAGGYYASLCQKQQLEEEITNAS